MTPYDKDSPFGKKLEGEFWVPFEATHELKSDGHVFSARPRSAQKDRIRIDCLLPNPVRIDVKAVPETYCRDFINTMASAPLAKRRACQNRLRILNDRVDELAFRVNGADLLRTDCESWPSVWSDFDYSFTVRPLPRYSTEVELFCAAEDWVVEAFRPVFDLLDIRVEGNEEGDVQRTLANEYERDPSNRKACIDFHGCRCAVCGFDFERVYGALGRGFIHVHHVVPVSELGSGYVVDPINDLIPVCPNCHAMLHRRKPPLAPEELRMSMASHNEGSCP